jgi:hypothetical protein
MDTGYAALWPPPGVGFCAVRGTLPVAVADTGTSAVRTLEETTVVATGLPLASNTVEGTKPEPLTVTEFVVAVLSGPAAVYADEITGAGFCNTREYVAETAGFETRAAVIDTLGFAGMADGAV